MENGGEVMMEKNGEVKSSRDEDSDIEEGQKGRKRRRKKENGRLLTDARISVDQRQISEQFKLINQPQKPLPNVKILEGKALQPNVDEKNEKAENKSQVPNTLHSRFAVLPERMVHHKLRKSGAYMCPNFYRLLLFRIRPFHLDTKTKSAVQRQRKAIKKCWHPMITQQTEMDDVPPSPSDAPHRLFQYECFDCTFRLIGFPFVPIVYLICDHFIDCPAHLVRDDIRQLFLRERESFTAFLGPDFNHDFLLLNEPSTLLTFHPFNPLNTYHCSLKLATAYCAQRAKEWADQMEKDFGFGGEEYGEEGGKGEEEPANW